MAKTREQVEREWATKMIRTHMVQTGCSYGDLVDRLALLGIEDNERNLRNKVARGTFSAAFMAQCLAAMGVQYLDIEIADELLDERELVAFEYTVAQLNSGMPMEEARISPDEVDEDLIARNRKVRRGKAGWALSIAKVRPDQGPRGAGKG